MSTKITFEKLKPALGEEKAREFMELRRANKKLLSKFAPAKKQSREAENDLQEAVEKLNEIKIRLTHYSS